MSLTQAEAVMEVIAANGRQGAALAKSALDGRLAKRIGRIQTALQTLNAHLTAWVDYPEEDVPELSDEAFVQTLTEQKTELDALINGYSAGAVLRHGVDCVLLGRPNVGKSTLFNAFLGEDRAIVTSIPGTTRDVLEESFPLDGVNVILSDTAGLRDSDDEVERIGVERARKALNRADAALLLVDASHALSPEDEALLRQPIPCPCAILLNKQDAGETVRPADLASLAAGRPIFPISALTGEGLTPVRDFLRGFLSQPNQWQLVQERHMALARQATDRLRQAQSSLSTGAPLDLAAIDLHEALYLLGRITGDSVDEQLLDDIFSRFCVGK